MELLARAFAAELRKEIGADAIAEVIRRNAAETNPGTCHSHDFIDANMVMDRAWRALIGREVRLPCDVEDGRCTQAECDRDTERWNAAWEMAVANTFYA